MCFIVCVISFGRNSYRLDCVLVLKKRMTNKNSLQNRSFVESPLALFGLAKKWNVIIDWFILHSFTLHSTSVHYTALPGAALRMQQGSAEPLPPMHNVVYTTDLT